MNHTSGLFDLTYAIYFQLAYFLPMEQTVAALLLSLPLAVVGVVVHELGHLGAARYFGVPAVIHLFPRRAEQGDRRKFWFLAPLDVVTDDDHHFALARWQRRVIIGAGPGIDAVVGLPCLLYGLALPVAPWVAVSVAFSGAVAILLRMPINLVPIRRLGNDGYHLIHPDCQDPRRR
ncbi:MULTISPECIES: M50 family metallopeptidase [unclassified Cupriavidus]|uniref:M50 family metallopeptidase n=1 Tax=unclassified Cupriavidus TaxID=2640874 RepID=UPI001AEB02B8|nr:MULTISPECIES: M50 family metallopeptidase [unclassified Cupriavidus]MBP0633623.1 M50 family metallopeptidase [Cupriavidus sp. AcVe19-1a]MBP0639928.1 M50 family metallopeptidase [Cupriavidus sp. AcVe19-6a]